MAFDTAFILKDPEAIERIGSVLAMLASTGSLYRGEDILRECRDATGTDLPADLLYALMEGSILKKRSIASRIEQYLFEIRFDHEYFRKEKFAAVVLLEQKKREVRKITPSVSFVATVPRICSDDSVAVEDIEPAIMRLASEVANELWIINPFFDDYGAGRLASPLVAAARSGVKIRILGRNVGVEAEDPCRLIVSALLDQGLDGMIEVRNLYKQDEKGRQVYGLHTKAMIADATAAYIGSANLTLHSLRKNFEIGVIVKGEAVSRLLDLIELLWSKAEPAPLEQIYS